MDRDRQWEMMARFIQSRLDRRRVLKGAAGAAVLPLAGQVRRTSAAPALTPSAVTAARRVLAQSGDSAEAAVAAANALDPKPEKITIISESALQAEDMKVFSGPLWEEQTGIKMEVVEKPFAELFPTMIQEHIGQTGAIDIIQIVPSWLADFVNQGVAEPLDPFIDQYMNKSDLDDFHPLYRDLMNYGGQIYGLFDDGDTLIGYYQKSLFADPANNEEFKAKHGRDLAPPATWQEYDEIQAFFTEKLQPGMYGGASQRQPAQIYECILQEFRINGGKFFDESTMDAQLNSEAGVATLTRMLESNKTMPPGVETWDFTAVLTAWMEGQLAMVGCTWPPFGRFSEEYGKGTKQMEWVPPSKVSGNVGYFVMPGGHSQMAAGFLLGVSADSKNKEAAYLWCQWANSPTISLQRVLLPYSLRDPFRLSHYSSEEYRGKWPTAGEYLDTLKTAADGALLDVIMPGSADYHTALDQTWGAAQGGTPVDQALADGAAAWNAITDRVGREQAKAAYAEYLKLKGAYPQ
jgi:multiple sugar transport system substrate-binding protein